MKITLYCDASTKKRIGNATAVVIKSYEGNSIKFMQFESAYKS